MNYLSRILCVCLVLGAGLGCSQRFSNRGCFPPCDQKSTLTVSQKISVPSGGDEYVRFGLRFREDNVPVILALHLGYLKKTDALGRPLPNDGFRLDALVPAVSVQYLY